MHTPRTYMRTSRTYILYSNDMHVKHTRQTERKKINPNIKQNKAYKHTWLKKFSAEDNISASIQNQCKTCSYTHHKHVHTKNIHAHTKNIHLVQQQHARKTHATNRTKKINPNIKQNKAYKHTWLKINLFQPQPDNVSVNITKTIQNIQLHHMHTHTTQMQTKINQTNKYRNHIKKNKHTSRLGVSSCSKKVKKHKLYVNKQTVNRKNKKENQVQTKKNQTN